MPTPRRPSRPLTGVAFALLAGCEVGVSAGTAALPTKPPPVGEPVPRRAPPAPSGAAVDAEIPKPTEVGSRVFVEDLVAGAAHACARSYAATVHCWGSNEHGQLGRDAGDFAATPAAAGNAALTERVFAGPTQTAVVTPEGQVGHWGLYAPRGDDGVTPWSTHDTPGVDAIEGVAFGERFALGWDGGGRVIGWGEPDRASFTTAFLVKPVVIHLGFRVTQAAVWSRGGDGHGCLVVRGGTVACWGRNDRGQLGRSALEWGIFQLPRVDRVARVTVGERFSCALRDDRTAWCWGADDAGQLGDGAARDRDVPARVPVPGEVLALSAGRRHACALTRDGAVWCWGANDRGQLGTTAVEILAATPVRVPGLPKATGVAAGDEFTCARTEEGGAFCWGANDRGQLGDGTTAGRASPAPVRL